MTRYRDHTEYRQFIKAICDRPSDDLPRLVFADWLEETGETEASVRADYIRTVIGNNNGEIRQMLSLTKQASWEPWASEPERQFPGCKFRWGRGFPEQVRLTLAQFEQHAAMIASEHPIAEDGWTITDRVPYGLGLQEHGYYWPIGMPERSAIGELAYHCAFRYQTREAAMKALSSACYVVARLRAEQLENMNHELLAVYGRDILPGAVHATNEGY